MPPISEGGKAVGEVSVARNEKNRNRFWLLELQDVVNGLTK